MNKKTKIIGNVFLFIGLVGLTLYILFKDQDVFEIFDLIVTADLKFILIGILCMLLYLVCEAINIGRTLKMLKEKSSFINNFKYALIGFFFSSITPAASGGQPMQIYYMYKDKIKVASSTLALLINLASMQIITITFALTSLVFNYEYLTKGLIIFFVVGILLNASALALLLIGIFSKKLSQVLMNFAIKVLKFFRIKKIEEKKEKFQNELNNYQVSSVYIRNNKKLMLKILLTTLVQFTLYYSITYWVYRSFGFNRFNAFEIITMQSVLFATVSGIPSPGAVGVTEASFMQIFKNVYPKNMMNSAVLLNRGINFYLFLIISGIIVWINHLVSGNDNGMKLEKIKNA